MIYICLTCYSIHKTLCPCEHSKCNERIFSVTISTTPLTKKIAITRLEPDLDNYRRFQPIEGVIGAKSIKYLINNITRAIKIAYYK